MLYMHNIKATSIFTAPQGFLPSNNSYTVGELTAFLEAKI